jgi:hypothetical protein
LPIIQHSRNIPSAFYTYLIHHKNLGSLQYRTSHAQQLLLSGGEVLATLGDRRVEVAEHVRVDNFQILVLVGRGNQVNASKGLELLRSLVFGEDLQRKKAHDFLIFVFIKHIKGRAYRAAQDSRILYSASLAKNVVERPISGRTRDDSQFTPEISETEIGHVDSIDYNFALGSLDEAEERECKRALARASSSKNTNFLARTDTKVELVQHVR